MTFSCAIVTPIYYWPLQFDDQFCLRSIHLNCGGAPKFFVAPQRLKRFEREMHILGLKVIFFENSFFNSLRSYNNLMMSKKFYKEFLDFEYILICQLDALLISSRFSDWCSGEYSYVGAPLAVGFVPTESACFYAVGNGGFSLRSVKCFYEFLSRPRIFKYRTSNINKLFDFSKYFFKWSFFLNRAPFFPRLNEDVFWGMVAPMVSCSFRVPPVDRAMEFAFEVAPRQCFELNGNRLPIGCHAWKTYDQTFWRHSLPDVFL